MTYYEQVKRAADTVGSRVRAPLEVAIVLGSGLGAIADGIEAPVSIPYGELPGWPQSQVAGHEGRLVAGRMGGRHVAVLAGRCHAYEGHDQRQVAFAVRAIGVLGVKVLVLTNAAGAVNPEFVPGRLMVVDDHINLTASNPLVGPNDDRFGPRFPDMTEVYSRRLRDLADRVGAAVGLSLHHGVYAALLGPCYETPAEIRYLRAIGADAVGMSTVPEAITARHMGIEVLGISCITNMAAGMLPGSLTHGEVLEAAQRVQDRLIALTEGVVARL